MAPRVLAILLLLMTAPLQAETYRWTDAQGRTHFSDQPPRNAAGETEKLEIEGPEPIGQGPEVDAIYERRQRLLNAEREQRKEKQQAQQRRQAARKQRCARARERLKRLKRAFVFVNEAGEARTVSEEEARQHRETVSQWIQEHCS